MWGRLTFVLVAFSLGLQSAPAARILAVLPYIFPSPFMLVTPYLKTLLANGHELTVVSCVSALPNIEGARHIRVEALEQLMEDISSFDFDLPMGKWQEATVISAYHYNASAHILGDSGVQALMRNAEEKFDMILLEVAHTDALYGLAQHFRAPMVGISAYGSAWNIDYLAGNSAPSIYEPIVPMGYKPGLSLLEKWHNWIYITEEWLLERLLFLPAQLQLYKKYFPHASVTLYDSRRNFSLILINQHFSLGRARSNVPNLIEVAGMHLDMPSAPCDPALQRFLDEANEGVIYFSMGIEIMSTYLPKDMQHVLMQTFAGLKQRVVWKYELQVLPNKSDNIYISNWLPQRELLAHHNVKLFITHGGRLSVIEAAYYGTPLLGLPVYYDQFGNVERIVHMGAALSLEIDKLSTESLTQAITELMGNPEYASKASDLSRRFRDQPMTPLETGIWWTEYVLRHKGAPHMRMDEEDISLMQYYSVNMMSVVFGRIALVAVIVICIGYKLVNCVMTPSHIGLSVPMIS